MARSNSASPAKKEDHRLAVLEAAADRAHLKGFIKTEVAQKVKARIATALNWCVEAATDLERFLGHAAVGVRDRPTHDAMHDAAKAAGDLVLVLQDALRSVDAFVDNEGTASGALRRAALEVELGLAGRTDERVLAKCETALLRTLGVYDRALAELRQAPRPLSGGLRTFRILIAGQRETISAIHRDFAHRALG